MNNIRKGASLLGLLLSATIAQADTLKIMAVYDPGVSTSNVVTQMNAIQTVFGNTPGLGGLSITLVNAGSPYMLSSALTGSTRELKRVSARNSTSLNTLRNNNDADLVVVYTDTLFGYCGYSGIRNLHNWSGTGAAVVGNPDLRQADDFFVVLVSETCAWNRIAAHEVGHLFGAGHERANGANTHGLFSDSRGDFNAPDPVETETGDWTVMISSSLPNVCDPDYCTEIQSFSHPGTTTNTPSSANYDNYLAVLATYSSVAAFREPPPCGLAVPTSVEGTLLDHCYGPNELSRHEMTWVDTCPAQTDFYQTWAQQPAGDPSGYDDHVDTVIWPWQESIFYVLGAAANMKVEACEGGNCSGLSTSWYYASYESECH